jgi:hypothetical protein
VVSFTPLPIYPWYPFDRRLGRLQSQYGCYCEEEDFLPLPGITPWLSILLSLYETISLVLINIERYKKDMTMSYFLS